ncbi:ABC transporter permease [Tellurirhabdus bombi]|uniref:ABC transporter permease n=1 Tax=Tellurirhabdus bombi TaxID=2907205 RepID=UPI001F3F4849|nr:ABC transporter permease [Tellurirhabdus bombi]
MIRNYLKIAFRNLWKNRLTTAINVVGLAVAFGSSVLLFLTAWFEWSYDEFHTNANQIFRTYSVSNDPEGVSKSETMPFPLVPTLKQEFPEVEKAARIMWGSSVIQYGDKQLRKQVRCTDADFLEMFSFPLKQGSSQTALNSLSSLVISENTANDIFGNASPMGKTVRIGSNGVWKDYVVTGVVADAPKNSTIEYDAFIRIENSPSYAEGKGRWDQANHEVFVKLRPDVDQATMEKRLRPFTAKYYQQNIREMKQNGAKPDSQGELFSLRLQPLLDVHLDTQKVEGSGTEQLYVYTLVLIGLFILAIAGINYVNLSLARIFTRAKEVGVRKTLGALPRQLFVQLWSESVLTCLAGLAFGLLLVSLLLPAYNTLFKSGLTLALIYSPASLLVILGGFLAITLLTGGYPAVALTRFNIVTVLKGKLSPQKPGALRNSLIVAQFALACLLITCTLVILQQLRYLRDKPLGFDEEQVISIPVGNDNDGNALLTLMRTRLATNPNVLGVTGTGVNLGRGRDGSSSRSISGFMHKGHEVATDWVRVDYDYLKTLGIKLLAGREFSPQYATDSVSSVIISASMAKALDEKTPVGARFQTDSGGVYYQVIGVIPDIHLYALHQKVKPITMHIQRRDDLDYILVRVTRQNMVSTMDQLKALYKELAPRSEFMASFLSENTDRWYKREERLSTIFSIAAAITVVLSCMGLFAIALLTIEQRTKEIGIRKVLGASVPGIVALLSQSFLKLVFLSIILASPVAWYAIDKWLQDFAYRIDVPWWVFLLSGSLAILIALLTVSFHSVKAALMNPVKSLRSE